MQLTGKDRSKKEHLLKMASMILLLEDLITEKQDLSRKQSIIEMNEEGVRKEALAALKAALAESISMPSSFIFQIFRIFPIPRDNSDF